VVTWLRDGDESTRRRYSRRKLLVAFATACQALHFAHVRGVVHRDLKPGNVMLGDYGEVYVLDWGLAKLLVAGDIPGPAADGPTPSGQTQRGATMGTPGFMAPEQVTGDDVDARADVYALGAILFELLALEPLHARGSAQAMYTSTLLGTNARPSVRAPGRDIPPELDAICVRATMVSRDDRFASVRELLDAVEQFLDGDRDMQRRRETAANHAQAAAAHLERALSSEGDEAVSRSRALQEVGRAITFDPTNADALRTLVRLLTDPPRDLPAEARAELSHAHTTHLATGGRAAGYAFLTWFLYAPLSVLMGVRSWAATAVVTASWLLAAGVSFASARRPPPDGKASVPILLAGSLAISCTAALFGPYFFVPGVAVIYGMMFTLVPPDPARRPIVVALCVAEIVVPVALSWMHVLPQPYEIGQDAVTIHAGMLHFPPVPTQVFLLLTSVVVVITACVMAATVRDALSAAESRLHVQAWQLRQILPPEAHRASSGESSGKA
ncbi:MAG TPA: serine/threonine-protein kinase, partial [Polyangiaceae bacterium]|nr:serine/threonine-protein kinase [Polyangiaceae bacterium]